MLRSAVSVAACVLLLLTACTPTAPEPEVLPIFADEQSGDDLLPGFVLEGDYTLRPDTTRYIGEAQGVQVFVGLGDVMGSPTNTCMATIVDEDTWMVSCSPGLPLTASLENGPTFVLHWPGDKPPAGGFEALGDYVWVSE